MGDIVIDANQLDKAVRKDTIIQTFDSLPQGGVLILQHNHDLLPLKKLFTSRYPGRFTWEYIKEEPEAWEIRIQKIFREDYKINELIEAYPQSILVFEKYRIEYFLKGEHQLADCLKAQYDIREVLNDIFSNEYRKFSVLLPRFNQWTVELIIQFILQNHHSYVHHILPEIEKLIIKIAKHHGNDQPEFHFFSERFFEFKDDLLEHMKEEEDHLFPKMLELEKSEKGNDDTFRSDVNWIMEDHYLVCDSLRSFRSICNQYSDAEIDIAAYPVLMEEMRKFEQDFHLHLHIENNVLFPKVLSFIK